MNSFKRALGTRSATLLVAGNMIGIGIFVTAGKIIQVIPNPALVLGAWVLGGLLSIIGGLAYAELATRFPRAGGGYVFQKEAFGPMLGFLAGFSSSMITIPGTTAFLAMGFTRYIGVVDPLVSRMIGLSLIAGISWINYRGVTQGAVLQDGFMVLKWGLIVALVGAGFGWGHGSWAHFESSLPLTRPLWVALPLALVPIMYTYSGWDATVYIAQEITNPRRTIPRSMVLGASLVMLTYILLTALYIFALPLSAPTRRIAATAAGVLFTPVIGHVVGMLISISVLGCLAATVLTGPRVFYAMAKDRLFPPWMARIHPRFQTPGLAIVVHGLWASLLMLTGTFDRLLDFITVPSVLFGAITVIGLFVVRHRHRHDEAADPFLMPGYPVLPAVFVAIMGFIVIATVIHDPLNSAWGLVVLALGIPVYWIVKRIYGNDSPSL